MLLRWMISAAVAAAVGVTLGLLGASSAVVLVATIVYAVLAAMYVVR